MNIIRYLSPGRRHELRMGVTVSGNIDLPYKDFESSMEEVMNSRLFMEDDPTNVYDPANPNWEESGVLFESVRKWLPRHPSNVLRLYNAIGSSLDQWHHVDLFFFWKEVYITIDLSLREKWEKVDLVVSLEGMNDEDFSVLGKQIADILKERRSWFRNNYRPISDPD